MQREVLENQFFDLDDIIIEDDIVTEEEPITEPVVEEDKIEHEEDREEDVYKIIASELGFSFEGSSDEEFKDALKQNARTSLLEDIESKELKGLLDFALNGGNISEYLDLVQPRIDNMKDEDIYRAYLKHTTTFSDTKIDKLIAKSIELDDFEDDVKSAKEYFTDLKNKSVEELETQQKALLEQQKEAARRVNNYKKELLSKKVIGNTEIPKGFDKYYNERTIDYKYEDKVYKLTPYEKYLVDMDEKQKIEHDMLTAMLIFGGTKPQDPNKQVNNLKDKLRSNLNKTNSTIQRLR